MKLANAIEIKSRTGEEFLHTDPDDIDEAERLSIEAMKRIDYCRSGEFNPPFELLPGETED